MVKQGPIAVPHFPDSNGDLFPVSAANPLPALTMSKSQDLLYRYLDTVGNGTGSKNAIGNYAAGATQFFIAPPAGAVYHIERMLVHIVDAGSFDSGNYGNGVVLTNGIIIQKQDNIGSVLIDFTDDLPVKTNPDWERECFDAGPPSSYGAGNEAMGIRYTFGKSGGNLRLVGDNNERLSVILNDDLTGLVGHYFKVNGYIL